MGIFDSLFKPDTSATTQAYGQQKSAIKKGEKLGIAELEKGLFKGSKPLNEAGDIFGQFGQQFQPGIDMYLNSLGLGGPEGNQAAVNTFQAGPGYQFGVDEALKGIMRNYAATGGTASGNVLQALQERGLNLANQEYGSWQDRLAGLINPAYSGFSGQAKALTDLSSLISGNYDNRANVRLGSASNMANAAGQYGQNMQAADTAATENFWGLVNGLLGAGAKVGGAWLGAPSAAASYDPTWSDTTVSWG